MGHRIDFHYRNNLIQLEQSVRTEWRQFVGNGWINTENRVQALCCLCMSWRVFLSDLCHIPLYVHYEGLLVNPPHPPGGMVYRSHNGWDVCVSLSVLSSPD